MTLFPYIVAYIAVGIFLIAVIVRFMMWSRMPMHLRWELYPIPHEAKRAHYGGSYLEETDWWKKPREVSLWGELKVMIPEIFFLVALREHNRKLWIRSFPFHFGLYLVICCTVLMIGFSVLEVLEIASISSGTGEIFQALIRVTGIAGLVLGLLGALGLLQRRFSDPELKDMSAPVDFFNLFFFIAVFGFALFHVYFVDRDFSHAYAFTNKLTSFQVFAVATHEAASTVTGVTVLLLSLLTAYIPLTHMSHFVGKYFAYHSIRWNDEPNLSDKKEEMIIRKNLNRPVSWNAPHIRGDRKKTWVDVTTEAQKK